MSIKGIVFDKDGTLFDFDATWGAWTKELLLSEAANPTEAYALADALGFDLRSLRFRPESIVIAATVGEIADRILTVLPVYEKPDLLARMNALAADAPQVPAPDLLRVITTLAKDGIALGVATNDGEAPARAHLKAAGIIDQFRLILGSDSGFGGKPATGQLDQFVRVTGLLPAECLMVGDSLHDLHAGRAAGMRTVGVLTGPAKRATLLPFADVVLDSIAELPDWVSSIA